MRPDLLVDYKPEDVNKNYVEKDEEDKDENNEDNEPEVHLPIPLNPTKEFFARIYSYFNKNILLLFIYS